MRKLTTDEFIEKSIEIWGNRFDYSLVEYENNKKKVKIICPIHGKFEQKPNNHLNSKYGCTQCGIEREKYNKIEDKRRKKEQLKKERIDNFFKKCKEIHGDRYDYSLVEYINTNSKVKIICREHGEFEQRASAHSAGQGCSECKFEKRRTGLDEFLIRCKEIHDDKFDYSLITEYKNSNTKVKVICKKHGEFLITPDNHINRKQGCVECKKLGLDGFLEKAKSKWGDRYDYSLVEYKNNKEKINIICKEHGVFEQRVSDHFNLKHGCPECALSEIRVSIDDFKRRSNIIHDNKYDYSKVHFKTNKDYIIINCPKHGDFRQKVESHMNQGQGCKKCNMVDLYSFIERANEIHNNYYDYNKSILKGMNYKINIICPKHGEFSQRASAHLEGQGCIKCKTSKGELMIERLLIDLKIEYITQKSLKVV
jgi:hypothetical protein